MKIIGLTGGICAGKSGVTKMLKSKGFPVIDCDKITDEFYKHQWFTDGLRHHFGKKIVYNGEVNRGKLGNLVFSDYKEMKKLNNYCKPFLFKEINKQLNELIEQGHEFIFIDAPILFESGLDKEVNFTDIWVVSVEKVEQIRRLKQRKNYLTPRNIQNILNSQWTNEQRIEKATFVIENNIKNRMQLRSKVERGLRIIGATVVTT